MDERSKAFSPPAALVAVVSWLIPGGGYWLLGQRARAITAGVTILILFFAGILIAGVRSLEVPGYSARGLPIYVRVEQQQGREGTTYTQRSGDDIVDGDWVLTSHPLDEIRSKPWTIAQIMAGPIDVLCDMWSVRAAQPVGSDGVPLGVRSHSRTNEIGVLYTAVAGMLNLLVIIDATHRASHTEHK